MQFVSACSSDEETNCNAVNCPKYVYIDKYEGVGEYTRSWDTMMSENRQRFIVLHICDCNGKMKISEYDIFDSTLLFEGSYSNGKDSTRVFPIDDFNQPEALVFDTITYSIPLRDGIWKYYNTNGKIIKEEKYDSGLLIQ